MSIIRKLLLAVSHSMSKDCYVRPNNSWISKIYARLCFNGTPTKNLILSLLKEEFMNVAKSSKHLAWQKKMVPNLDGKESSLTCLLNKPNTEERQKEKSQKIRKDNTKVRLNAIRPSCNRY